MKTVISLSGGLDSTYVLWKLLSTTTEEITAIFLDNQKLSKEDVEKYDIRGYENININVQQREVVQNICEWLKKNVRSFTFIKHPIDSSRFHLDNTNSLITYFIDYSIEMINAGTIDKIVCSTEKENDGWSHGGTKNGIRRPGSMEFYDRFIANAKRGELSFPLLDAPYTQANALKEMPNELINLSSSCSRSPVAPCGECFKCKKRQFFLDQINEGKTLEEIIALVESNSLHEDGTWKSMKVWLGDMKTDAEFIQMPEWPSSYKIT
jgi:hypothetical protein